MSTIGDVATCPDDDAGKDVHTAGRSHATCVLGLAGGSSEVTGAQYLGSGHDHVPGAPDHEPDEAVTWRQ